MSQFVVMLQSESSGNLIKSPRRPGRFNSGGRRAVNVSPQAMNIVLRGLEDMGAGSRPPSVPVGRALPARLTTAGAALLERTDAVVQRAESRVLSGLTNDERRRLLEIVIDQNAGRVPVIAHTGAITTAEAVALTAHAVEAGSAAVTRALQPGFRQYYETIASVVATVQSAINADGLGQQVHVTADTAALHVRKVIASMLEAELPTAAPSRRSTIQEHMIRHPRIPSPH